MAKKQDWSPRHITKAKVTIELVLGLGEESGQEGLDLGALKKTVEAYVQHGTFMEGLGDALANSSQPVDPISWRVLMKGTGQ